MSPLTAGSLAADAIFVQKCWEEHQLRHTHQRITFFNFTRNCKERWKTMTECEKKPFHEMAGRERTTQKLEMGTGTWGVETTAPAVLDKFQAKKTKLTMTKEMKAPKRSVTAYVWFCKNERPNVKQSNPNYTSQEVAKELGRMWADLDFEAKKNYQEMSENDKSRYEKEMLEYQKMCSTESTY